MSDSDLPPPKRTHFGFLLLISFVTFNLGYIVDQTVRWSDHFRGLMNGVFHMMIFGIAWCCYLLPWSLVVYALYQWRKWRRFRAHWVLGPAILMLIVSIGSLIINPTTPRNRFKKFANIDLPTNMHSLQVRFTGGGFVDYGDTYYFQTTPYEVARIVKDMGLSLDESYGFEGSHYTPVERLPNGPDFSAWEGAKQYRGSDANHQWFYYLITDSSQTQVYMLIGCT